MLARVSGSNLVVAGDGRCDSPGFSAKYCTYSLLDTATNLIVHVETLKRSDVCIVIWFHLKKYNRYLLH